MTLPIGTFSSTGQEAHADQTVEEVKLVEGINYYVKINDSIESSEIIK